MTDNEKRAHDLAVAVMQIKASFMKDDCTRQGRPFSADFFQMYQAAYDEALARIDEKSSK